jgi:hypothetical protein
MPGNTTRVPMCQERRAFTAPGASSRRTASSRRSTLGFMAVLPSFLLDENTVGLDEDSTVALTTNLPLNNHGVQFLHTQETPGILGKGLAGVIDELHQQRPLGQLFGRLSAEIPRCFRIFLALLVARHEARIHKGK